MKNPNLVIDIGQTFIKFVVIDNNYKIVDNIIINNNLLIRKKILNYNINKLKNIIILNTKKILKKHKIKKIIPITHGSASFFLNEDKKYLSGPHFLQDSSKSFDKAFFHNVKKNDYTHSLKFDCYHNLGKSFYYLIKNIKKLKIKKIFTFPSLVNYILTDKLYLDKSYLACHSYVWNFKRKKMINFFLKYKRFFPQILSSGKAIGYLKKEYFNKRKVKVLNGIHDTSGSYLAFNKNQESKNSLIINTGTYFIISKKIKFIYSLKKDFYCNYGANNNLYLCKRLNAGLIFQKFNPKMLFQKKKLSLSKASSFYKKNNKKNIDKLKIINKSSQINDFLKLNYYIAKKLSKQISNFTNNSDKYKIFIDGNFVKNEIFIYFLKRLVKCKIFINNNPFINCLGASTFFNKKSINLQYKRT